MMLREQLSDLSCVIHTSSIQRLFYFPQPANISRSVVLINVETIDGPVRARSWANLPLDVGLEYSRVMPGAVDLNAPAAPVLVARSLRILAPSNDALPAIVDGVAI